ncbi:MAG: hypothetical protein RL240_3885, partial [Planctomycetota bacterium]
LVDTKQYRTAANTAMGWKNANSTERDDAVAAPRRGLGLATIVPFCKA